MDQVKKTQIGVVVSHKMNKTVLVSVERRTLDQTFKKYRKQISKFKVHDEKSECGVGDKVEIVETRPISKEKKWRVFKVLKKAENVGAITV